MATLLRLDATATPAEADLRAIETGIDTHNAPHIGPDQKVAVFLRDGEDRVRGGAVGWALSTDFLLALLYVDADLRGKGHGRAVLRETERLAVAHGCRRLMLDTHDFQAPDFYRRNGYAQVGRIDDYVHGHGRTWFRKTLVEAA
jgi:GNAT superfamily N-acetyltransferase